MSALSAIIYIIHSGVGFAGSVAISAVQHQTPAPLKLPSDGGKLEEWWVKSQSEMANADLQSRMCAGGAAGDASWRGACSEFVKSASILCTEECRHLRGGSDFFGSPSDDTFDVCTARDEHTCYNVCLDDKLFDSEDVVLGNGTIANPPCINQTAYEMTSVRREREDFWNHVLTSSAVNPGDTFWTDEKEWKAMKKAQKRLQTQFDDFWDVVCKNSKSAACEGVATATKKTFLLAKSSRTVDVMHQEKLDLFEAVSKEKEFLAKTTFLLRKSSRTSGKFIGQLRSKSSVEAYKRWFQTSQFPVAVALSGICQSRSIR